TGRDMTMRDGLVYSKNTITAQVMQDVGLPPIIKLARALGIRDSKLEKVPSLALGTSPVTLLEMVNAYASIAAQGEARLPFVVTHITDREGKVVARFGEDKPKRAMKEASAATLTDMMRGVIDRGTGTAIRSRFGIRSDVAGKSGTTQNNADGWFILMHPELVGGAWVGFNDARVTMRSNYWGQGGHNAVLVVGDFFKTALDTGKLSRDAIFPGGKPPPPLRHVEPVEAPQDEPVEEPGDLLQEGAPPAPLAVPAEEGGQDTHGKAVPEPAPAPAPQPAPQPMPQG
ncbi:MAG: penicillin-binding transpeptidase domain-containing protein, partial [Janthinobacterium sp.]